MCPTNSSESTNIAIIDVDFAGAIELIDALTSLGANAIVTESGEVATNSAGLIIASSAEFETTVKQITARRFDEVIERRIAGGRPVLGIGTGMQILFEKFVAYSTHAFGLGEWPGTIEEIGAFAKQRGGLIKVDAGENSKLFSEIKHESFWFENNAALKTWSLEVYGAFRQPSVSLTSGPEAFVAAVENGPLSAVQFLPEKSGNAGLKMLGNWISTL